MHVKKHLSFSGLRKTISQRFEQIEDHRTGDVDYSIHDCLMSALAMMFFQDPSLLQFQKRIQETANKNNLKSLFCVQNIPGDTQLRDVIDACSPEKIEDIFADFFRSLQRGKHLEPFQVLNGQYLVLLDGSDYFSSDKINCPGCLKKQSSKGKIRYSHQILQAVLAHPDQKIIIPLAPEPVKNEDGSKKQDCEINASKRILADIRRAHPKLKIVIGGDGLYSKQPFINELKKHSMSYVLVAKPADHTYLFEWVDQLRDTEYLENLEFEDSRGYTHCYSWANKVPLNGQEDSDEVNFFKYSMIRKDGKTTFRNSWVTDIEIDSHNVAELVKVGRARWKIENEGFNTLKNQGYHIEHNFGHGQKNLSYIFFLLNLLAFFIHQIGQLCDPWYQHCRTKFSSRQEFWNQLRCTLRLFVFKTWESLLGLIIDPDNWQRPP